MRLPYPSYVLYKTLAEIQGARSEEVHFQPDWSLGDDFAAARRRSAAGVSAQSEQSLGHDVVAGADSRNGRATALSAVWSTRRMPILPTTNCLDLVARCDKIMVSRTLSKSYALAGLRFGYVVAQPHMIEQLAKVKDSYNCDALSIAAATAAIGDQAWLAENRAKILATRSRLIAGHA